VVRSASAEARAEGVAVGLRRREAEARCAGLVVLDADDAADARVFELVVRAIEELVPRLVLERPGQLSFPTRGPSRYFGGDDALAARIVALVRDVGVVDVRVGIAAGTFGGRVGGAGNRRTRGDTRVIARGESAAFLAPWPVTVLAGSVDAVHGGAASSSTCSPGSGCVRSARSRRYPTPRCSPVRARRCPRAPLARGEVEHDPVATVPPEELAETIELDPPATRVDEAAFAAKMLADRLLAHLDALGLCCTRVVVEAETEHGERLTRCWRHEGVLTPATLVARVRWQLDAWLMTGAVTAGLSLLRLAPDDLGPATGRQLGFWGGDPAAADRAGRALPGSRGCWARRRSSPRWPRADGPRWSGCGGPVGGGARRRARGGAAVAGGGAGTGAGPDLRPAARGRVARRRRRAGDRLRAREPSAAPAACGARVPGGGGPLVAWNGPWAHDLRWWTPGAGARCGRWWSPDARGDDDAGVACLVVLERGHAASRRSTTDPTLLTTPTGVVRLGYSPGERRQFARGRRR